MIENVLLIVKISIQGITAEIESLVQMKFVMLEVKTER